ncbi:MAG: hypothetical protein L3K17_08795 [Thermoplasmata archaeon]|nr:hypothetical protein [Thermoplasmata archaeon]
MTRYRSMRMVPLAGLVPVVALLVVLLLPGGLASPIVSVGIAHPSRGGVTTGVGKLSYCASAMTSSDTGYVCERATVVHGVGFARGWVQVQANAVDSNLSGWHNFWGVRSTNLSYGFAQDRLSCINGLGGANAQVYVFWHVWVYDVKLGTYVDQLNSGYLWNSNSYSCPPGGGSVLVFSPPIKGAFNSTSYGSFGYDFAAGHPYLFTFFLGCTAQAQVTATGPTDQSVAGAFCNDPQSATRNTFTTSSIGIS